MKVNLFPFQKTALVKLRQSVATALGNYRSTHTPQVVSYTAPTGSGKTIIMASLIESIYYGDEFYPDQNDAIFVWLSDSPQLNEQSKLKIETKADKCFGRCVTITDESFDREILEDGYIYFLNTQKLSKSSNLTKHTDMRQYTIWETLANTVHEKSDHLYFIIDEAHRGAQKSSELAKATTIMQKFLKGSDDDRLPAMPVVIGMTATPQRFRRLAENIQSTTHYVTTTAEEVRASGLLKDRIVITYPETAGNDMAVLQAAADEWKHKWDHWTQYCYEQHYAYVNPIMVIQVQNAQGNRISSTDMDECIRIIEERTGERFSEGQIVHAFGEGTSTIVINGLNVPYVEPSRIAEDKKIKIVFFKETLSTGWDCPRAETMMSFRHANDYTYIAQLLGRMVRTPMQMSIKVDETLNDVHLYLPQFNENTVYDVVEALRSSEGANIPTDVEAEEIGANNYDTLTLRPTYSAPARRHGQHVIYDPDQLNLFDMQNADNGNDVNTVNNRNSVQPFNENVLEVTETAQVSISSPISANIQPRAEQSFSVATDTDTIEFETGEEPSGLDIDREAVVKAINDAGLLTYNVRKVRITDYLKSMYALARFLTQTRIDMDAQETVISDIVKMIHDHIAALKNRGLYEDLENQVLQFKLNTQIFDVFGKSVDNNAIHDMLSTTDTDIERQFRLAETRLGNEGIGNAYCNRYYEENDALYNRIDVIIFAADVGCMESLHDYAKVKFHELNDENRRRTVTLPERFKKKYDDIVSDGDIISKHNFRLPETIRIPHETEGVAYNNHLFVDNSGTAVINLNGWEQKVIDEEQEQEDFVCWLRNPSRGSWALCIPYEIDGETKPTYPDFLVVRREGPDYIVDVLEPHDPTRIDNLGKARGFAEYARQNPGVGRIQFIKMKRDATGKERPFRLDMSRSLIRDKVSRCVNIDELNHIFDDYGFFI
ncbi:MAG: DEAD/DEAH box helicase family protein [Oscillospiraceae bacterium]|nr:DEAD/DEAH box helicase family protein [Oscillospiraceae bacterium]